MLRQALLALLFLGSAFVGCISPADMKAATHDNLGASVPVFDVNQSVALRLSLPMKDGTHLDVMTWRPKTDEKVPILADIGPYYGNLAGDISKAGGFDARTIQYFLPRGYAYALVSVRGTGQSEGCFDLGGAVEQQDVHDAVEQLARLPWSNGAVAVIGKSYDGTTPWEAAITHPAGLRTIVPISGITDMYRYTFHDGTTYPENVGFETYYNLLVDQDVDQGPPPTFYGQNHTQENVARTCYDDAAGQSAYGGETILDGNHGTAFWQERDYEPRIPQIDVPVFLVHGLHDWNVKPDNGVPMFDNLSVPKAAWLGQWDHNYPDVNTYKPEWSRHDWNETLLTWFDHWLKGVDNNWTDVAHVEAQDQAGLWHAYADDQWPPADAQDVTLWLTQGKMLSPSPAQPGSLAMQDANPQQGVDPVAGTGGLAFLGAPVPRDVTLLGLPTLDVSMSLDRLGGNLGVTWYDVGPDGKWTEWDHGSRELMHRDSREQGTPVTPMATFSTTVNLYPTETTLAAGHRLGLALSPELPAWIEPSPLAAGGSYAIMLGPQGARLHVLAEPADVATLRGAMDAG